MWRNNNLAAIFNMPLSYVLMLVYILTVSLQSVIIWVVAAKRVWANWISKFIFISYLIKTWQRS